jgi:hypothetical protein
VARIHPQGLTERDISAFEHRPEGFLKLPLNFHVVRMIPAQVKITIGIVLAVAVNMMDNLFAAKLAANSFLYAENMLQSPRRGSGFHFDANIPTSINPCRTDGHPCTLSGPGAALTLADSLSMALRLNLQLRVALLELPAICE